MNVAHMSQFSYIASWMCSYWLGLIWCQLFLGLIQKVIHHPHLTYSNFPLFFRTRWIFLQTKHDCCGSMTTRRNGSSSAIRCVSFTCLYDMSINVTALYKSLLMLHDCIIFKPIKQIWRQKTRHFDSVMKQSCNCTHVVPWRKVSPALLTAEMCQE